jgi:transcriptional regulator
MYTPSAFEESRPAVLQDIMRRYPLATLITHHAGGVEVTHLPLLYFPEAGVLRGHMARANPQWQNATAALALFHGPQHYISPNWYATKPQHGKVVPTWNYVAIHAHGTLTMHHDAAWLLDNVRALTDQQEASQPHPWSVDDAPADYIAGLTRAIVGVELQVLRLEGKWKVSQNRPAEDRHSVAAGLRHLGTDAALAMSTLVESA